MWQFCIVVMLMPAILLPALNHPRHVDACAQPSSAGSLAIPNIVSRSIFLNHHAWERTRQSFFIRRWNSVLQDAHERD
jgi:hypothetical protein